MQAYRRVIPVTNKRLPETLGLHRCTMMKMSKAGLETKATANLILGKFVIAVDSLKLLLIQIPVTPMTALRLDQSSLAPVYMNQLMGQGHKPRLRDLLIFGRYLWNHHLAALKDGWRLTVDHKGVIAEVHRDEYRRT